MTAEEMVREYMRVLDEARQAAARSVLDGTISCQLCRALVLESNAEGHQEWHDRSGDTDERCRKCGRLGHSAERC